MHINIEEKNVENNEYPTKKGIISINNKKFFIIIFSILDVLFITIFLTVLFEIILEKGIKRLERLIYV